MLKRRILTVALAVLLAAVGTVAVLAYVHQANIRAVAGLKAVNVIVAEGAIPSGTSAGQALREGLLGSQRLPAASVPADAVRSITPGPAGLVTSGAVPSGQLLLRPMLVAAAQVTGGVAIPKGMVAVTMQLCLPEDVAGYVTAGAKVAVFDTYGSNRAVNLQRTCNVSHQALQPSDVRTAIVLPTAEVLSVGPAPSSVQGAASGGNGVLSANSASSAVSQGAVLVTLAVQQANAERLIEIGEAGLPYLALLTSTSGTRFDAAPVPLIQP
jgi:pilus assembly protein CpaB